MSSNLGREGGLKFKFKKKKKKKTKPCVYSPLQNETYLGCVLFIFARVALHKGKRNHAFQISGTWGPQPLVLSNVMCLSMKWDGFQSPCITSFKSTQHSRIYPLSTLFKSTTMFCPHSDSQSHITLLRIWIVLSVGECSQSHITLLWIWITSWEAKAEWHQKSVCFQKEGEKTIKHFVD